MAPSLRRLSRRRGNRPAIDPKWPCLQQDQTAPGDLTEALAAGMLGLSGVRQQPPPFGAPGIGLALPEDLARGQPEAFVGENCWAILRPDGALHLSLRPEWAQKVLSYGWATVHPFARYMAGAVPPQSLVVFAPRDAAELAVAGRIAEAAHGYAVGRFGDFILPDTRW